MPNRLLPVSFAVLALPFAFARGEPLSPLGMCARLESRLVAGEGVLLPDADAEVVHVAGTVDLSEGDWPAAFAARAGGTVCVAVSPSTGCYEFFDESGEVFWTVVPVSPTTENWVAPFRHAEAEPSSDDALYESWRLVDVWHVLHAEAAEADSRAEFAENAERAASRPRLREAAEPDTAVSDLCFTAFAPDPMNLRFTVAWPTNETLPDDLLDVYGSTNLSGRWTFLCSAPVATNPVSFVVDPDALPWHVVPTQHVHDATCPAATNVVVSQLDGVTVYTNVIYLCSPPRPPGEVGFFRVGTRHDTDGDGFPDAFERLVLGTSADAVDTDFDGLSDNGERVAGTDPLVRDTDGDGVPDGIDPDPLSCDAADADGNGIPDSFEVFWFGSTTNVPAPAARDGTGFSLLGKLASALCPTNAPFEETRPTARTRCVQLVPRFGTEWPAGSVVWEKTYSIGRHGEWEQFFVSSDSDPVANGGACDGGAWTLDGMVLEWSDSGGASGATNASPLHSTFQLPLSVNGPASLTLRLRTLRDSLSSCPRPLCLLTFVPEFELPDAPTSLQDGRLLAAALVDDDVRYAVDRSGVPCTTAVLPCGRSALPFDAAAPFTDARDPTNGPEVVTGTLRFSAPGVFGIPVPGPETPAPAPLRAPAPPGEFLLAVLSPRFAWRDHGWWWWWRLSYDWLAGHYSRHSSYPFDSPDLWYGWQRDERGWWTVADYPERVDPGVGEWNDLFETGMSFDEHTLDVTGLVLLGGDVVWSNDCSLLVRVDDWETADPEAGGCGCGGTDDLEGPSHSSLGFRIPLGDPRKGQVSGFLWFRTEDPVAVSNGLFEVLARPDAAVSDTATGGVRTVACSDERGRTVVLEPVANGVRATVSDTATGALQHTWDVVNENGSRSRVRLTKTSRLGNTMSDVVYVHDGSDWNVFDPVANTLETLVKTDLLDDPDDPVYVEERILADASDPTREYSHAITTCRRFGSRDDAVLREVSRVENPGTAFERVYETSYWDDTPPPSHRFGRPRLRTGNARAWSWTDYDRFGRPVLSFDQFDGSSVPFDLDDGTHWTLANRPAGLRAVATVFSYAPLPGDSDHRRDLGEPRTVSRFLVDGPSSNLLSRTWTVIARGETNGWPCVSVRTERAASQSAAFGDPGNAVSLSVRVDEDAEFVPLLLRGRPLSFADEDGVTTVYDYAFGSWDPATRSFAAASGASHLRTRSFVVTPEAPTGVPLVSTVSETVEDAVHGNEVWTATRVLLADGSLSEPFDWEARVHDEKDRLRSIRFSDGSSSTNAWSCCRLLFTVDRNGMKRERLANTGTDHLRHAWLDVSFASLPKNQSNGFLLPKTYDYSKPEDFRAVASDFDPLGRETVRRTMATRPRLATSIGSLRPAPGSPAARYWWDVAETNFYPSGTSDHRVRVDARGLRTETAVFHDEAAVETRTDESDGTNLFVRTVSRSVRGGASETFRAWDGGWTTNRTFTLYGVDGCRTVFSVTEASDAPPVTNSVSVADFLGRTVRVATPLSDSSYAYDGASSRVLSVSDSVSGVSSATLYDSLREPVGSLGPDGVASLSTTRYERDASDVWWRVSETREAAGDATNLLLTVRERLTGLSDALRSETVSVPAGGPVSATTVSFDPATLVATETNLVEGLAPLVHRSKFGRTTETQERDGTVRKHFFDPYGRPYLMGETPPGGSFVWRTWTYRDELGDAVADMEVTARNLASMGLATNCAASLYDSGSVAWNGFLTQRRFDIRGNVAAIWNPEGRGTFFVRDGVGRLVQTYGATYPSARILDTAGRLVALGTTRAGDVWDVTQWGYDPATGLCTNKAYADGTAVSRAFTADGLPSRTTLASGRWTQNAYDADRRLSATTDSDGNSVQYAYDAFGRLASATDGAGRAEAFARNALGVVTNETQAVFDGTWQTNRTAVLDRPLDAFGRPAGLSLQIDGDFAQSICYDYGVDGRISGMVLTNAQGRSVSVEYDWEQGRFTGCTIFDSSGTPIFARTVARAPRRPALATSVVNAGVAPSADTRSFSYAYDAVGRPVERGADAFAYNVRGEVTNATIAADTWNYAYDYIGNRTAASDSAGTTAFMANNVNQYTAVGTDEPEYDTDGNLVAFGNCTNAWNAAGQLVSTTWNGSNCLARLRSEYDRRGRRVRRVSETSADDGATWTAIETRTFVYDDWNLIYERSERPSEGAVELAFFWGPDLSGSFQGAGGVGGLVAVSVNGSFFFPGYDNNGNVVGYWNESGDIVAEYAYDAFGNTVAESGSMADFFPHRFSTKYYDAETDLYYYGYRYYSPSLGRWISRDPAEERGGLSLYLFCFNDGVSHADFQGLSSIRFFTRNDSGEERDISSENDVFHVFVNRDRTWGNFPKPLMDFRFGGWFRKLCEVNFNVVIQIMSSLKTKTDHQTGEVTGYKLHVYDGSKLSGGISFNPTFQAVLDHEKGHAKAFFEIVKPDLEKRIAPYIGRRVKNETEESALVGLLRKEFKEAYDNPLFWSKSAEYSNQNTLDYYDDGRYERIDSPPPDPPVTKRVPDLQWKRK